MRSPLDALRYGIAMIHQELNLMAYMTVAENIWLRREPRNALGFINHREMRRRTQALFDRLEIDIDPEIEVRDLSVANRQMVEIAKAVSPTTATSSSWTSRLRRSPKRKSPICSASSAR